MPKYRYERGSSPRYWPDYVSLETIAERLDCTPEDIERLVLDGELPPPILIGNLERWDYGRVHGFISRKFASPAGQQRIRAPGEKKLKDPFIAAIEAQKAKLS